MNWYHPSLVALHWVMALVILVALAAGGVVLANMPPDSPDKVQGLGGHRIFGMAIGGLLVLRLLTRVKSMHPALEVTGNALLDRIGVRTHHGSYVLIAGIVLIGLHLAAALYQQFVLKDGLLRRKWFGTRSAQSAIGQPT